MGALIWSLQSFLDTLLDIVVIKTGLVISEDHLVELLQKGFPEDSRFRNVSKNKNNIMRVRSEEFDSYCWHIRKHLGELDYTNPMLGSYSFTMLPWYEKGHDVIKATQKVLRIMGEMHNPLNPKSLDGFEIFEKAVRRKVGPRKMIIDIIYSLIQNQTMSNIISPVEEINWDGGTNLTDLFNVETAPKKGEAFLEQKFINYLEANPDQLEYMHWRNFERLTAEFFNKQGYKVQLGTGTKDGGIDIRVFNDDTETPYIIIQCKRHKKSHEVKIETVKSFYTDVAFEGAKKGLIATTSRIAPGGKTVSTLRKYPLEFAENEEIKSWLKQMKQRTI